MSTSIRWRNLKWKAGQWAASVEMIEGWAMERWEWQKHWSVRDEESNRMPLRASISHSNPDTDWHRSKWRLTFRPRCVSRSPEFTVWEDERGGGRYREGDQGATERETGEGRLWLTQARVIWVGRWDYKSRSNNITNMSWQKLTNRSCRSLCPHTLQHGMNTDLQADVQSRAQQKHLFQSNGQAKLSVARASSWASFVD